MESIHGDNAALRPNPPKWRSPLFPLYSPYRSFRQRFVSRDSGPQPPRAVFIRGRLFHQRFPGTHIFRRSRSCVACRVKLDCRPRNAFLRLVYFYAGIKRLGLFRDTVWHAYSHCSGFPSGDGGFCDVLGREMFGILRSLFHAIS